MLSSSLLMLCNAARTVNKSAPLLIQDETPRPGFGGSVVSVMLEFRLLLVV